MSPRCHLLQGEIESRPAGVEGSRPRRPRTGLRVVRDPGTPSSVAGEMGSVTDGAQVVPTGLSKSVELERLRSVTTVIRFPSTRTPGHKSVSTHAVVFLGTGRGVRADGVRVDSRQRQIDYLFVWFTTDCAVCPVRYGPVSCTPVVRRVHLHPRREVPTRPGAPVVVCGVVPRPSARHSTWSSRLGVGESVSRDPAGPSHTTGGRHHKCFGTQLFVDTAAMAAF